eukprot:2422014-Pleurochrysis_carterae.AAC.1
MSGRASWDPMAVLLAVRGAQQFYEYEIGEVSVDPRTGANSWTRSGELNGAGALAAVAAAPLRGQAHVRLRAGQQSALAAHLDELM